MTLGPVKTLLKSRQETIDQNAAPTSNTGLVLSLIGGLANRVRAITGKTNWWEAPATTLEAANAHHGRTDNPHATTAAQVGAVATTNHNKALHDLLGIDAATLDGLDSTEFLRTTHTTDADPHTQYFNQTRGDARYSLASHSHVITPKALGDPIGNYSFGLTMFPATSLAGYPTTNGAVHTTRISNDLTFQIFSNRLGTDRYMRWWDSSLNTGAGGWTAFTALGGAGGSVSQASETVLGGAEVADATESSGGTNHLTIMTPLRVAERVNTRVSVSSPILETFIEGLGLWWDSGTGISLSSGAAWIQSLGRVVNVPSALTLSALTLTASTWYYVYLFENAGAPAIEVVTTAPTAPTKGMARAKNGDLTRRFLGTLRVGASGAILRFEHYADNGEYRYVESGIAAGVASPYRLISGGAATANTNVSCAALAPPTSTEMLTNILTNGTSSAFFGAPGVTGDHTWTNVNNPGTQNWMKLDATQALRYRNGAAGGSTILDCYGYREGR